MSSPGSVVSFEGKRTLHIMANVLFHQYEIYMKDIHNQSEQNALDVHTMAYWQGLDNCPICGCYFYEGKYNVNPRIKKEAKA